MEPQNLHCNDFNLFMSELKGLKNNLKDSGSKEKLNKVENFIKDNQDWMLQGMRNPALEGVDMRVRMEKLAEKIKKIEGSLDSEVAKTLDQYLKEVPSLPQELWGKIIIMEADGEKENEVRKFGQRAPISKGFKTLAENERINLINKNKLRLVDLGFQSAEEAVNFLINSDAKNKINYLNFDDLPINNEQFEKLTKNCPNLNHLEIKNSLLYGEALKHLERIKDLMSLNIRGCYQLEADALKHLEHIKNLTSLNIS